MNFKKVTVIGAGTMGRQIALNAAINECITTLNDQSEQVLADVKKWSDGYLDSRVRKGKMTEQEALDTKKRFLLEIDLEKAAKDADLVIEAIVEKLDVKLALFAELERICGSDTVFASNSSTFFPSQYSVATKRPDKVIGMHYFNPALQMELLEVVLSDDVSAETLEAVKAYGRQTKKKVIVVQKEIPGFVVNNIFGGITSIAWELLDGGYASYEDIDIAAEKGLGHPMGPFRTMDYSGLDTILSVRKSRHELDPEKYPAPNEVLTEMVEKGRLGVKTGEGFYNYKK